MVSFIFNQFKANSTMNHQWSDRKRNFLVRAMAESTLHSIFESFNQDMTIRLEVKIFFNHSSSSKGKISEVTKVSPGYIRICCWTVSVSMLTFVDNHSWQKEDVNDKAKLGNHLPKFTKFQTSCSS